MSNESKITKENCIGYMYNHKDCSLKELERVSKRETGGVRVHAAAAMTNSHTKYSTGTNGFTNLAIHITNPAFCGGYGLSSVYKIANVIFEMFGICIDNTHNNMIKRTVLNDKDGLTYIITKEDIVKIVKY
jgi:hypothetical protein